MDYCCLSLLLDNGDTPDEELGRQWATVGRRFNLGVAENLKAYGLTDRKMRREWIRRMNETGDTLAKLARKDKEAPSLYKKLTDLSRNFRNWDYGAALIAFLKRCPNFPLFTEMKELLQVINAKQGGGLCFLRPWMP